MKNCIALGFISLILFSCKNEIKEKGDVQGEQTSFVSNQNTTDSGYSVAYLPTSTTKQIVKHQYYTLSYNEKFEQAEWVAYELKKQKL